MNTLKRAAALLVVSIMILSLAACHPKDETALSVGDVKITSALYMSALMNADGEARTMVDEKLAEQEENQSATEEVDYFSQKLDGKSYTDWVKDRAIDICLENIAYEIKCNENDLSLTEEKEAEIDTYVDYYWTNYGYQTYYESNGVSKESFKRSLRYGYLANEYFEFLYGEGGEKAVAADEVTEALQENFVVANVLSASLSGVEQAQAATLKAKFADYEARLNKGVAFSEIYNEYYEIKETAEDTAETEADAPKEKYATVLGSEDTEYANENFETVKGMTIGEVKLVTTDSSITLFVRVDMMGDEYWVENLTTPALVLLKGEEFDKDIAAYIETLDYKKNNYAINRFKVKNIVYPTYY